MDMNINNNNRNNMFIVQVRSNIEQDFKDKGMLMKSSSDGTIIHFVECIINEFTYCK